MIALPVPHETQLGVGLRNACGQTCASMILQAYDINVRPEEVAQDTNTDDGSFTTIGELLSIGRHYGQTWHFCRTADINWHLVNVAAGRPAIALVDYRKMPNPPMTYKYAHFVVVVGADDSHVWVQDPLRADGPTSLTHAEFSAAVSTPSLTLSGTNHPNQAIYPEEPLMPTRAGLGFNIHANYLSDDDFDLLVKRLRANPPASVLVMDHLHRALFLQNEFPNMQVIFRLYLGDNAYQRMSPQQWLSHYQAAGATGHGLWLYADNEPTATDANIPVIGAWLLEVARLTVEAGERVVLGNFSVGTPEPDQWPRLHDLLQFIARHPERLALGLHEYFPTLASYEFGADTNPFRWPTVSLNERPWLCGRFRHAVDYARAQGWFLPVVITEFGTDTIHAASAWQSQLVGCRDRMGYNACLDQWAIWQQGDPDAYAFRMMQWLWKAVYQPFPEVRGQAFFSYGGEGAWTWYDVKGRNHLHSLIASEGDFSVTNQATTTPPRYGPGTWKLSKASTDYVNVRADTSTSAPVLIRIYGGNTLTVLDADTRASGGYRWYPVQAGGFSGWCAMEVAPWKRVEGAVQTDRDLLLKIKAMIEEHLS